METPSASCKTSHWYPMLANYTFPTSFVHLKDVEIQSLADGETKGPIVNDVINRLAPPMSYMPGNCFVFADNVAPTDTERFEYKRGAVYSARSAWRFLAASFKVRNMAEKKGFEYLCVRPFRRMNKTREFRLFIVGGQMKAMSQYWLIQHFKKLAKLKSEYWDRAKEFVEELSWTLPHPDIVMDVYFTSDGQILIIDFNSWGDSDPLLLNNWQHDWEKEIGFKIIPPPTSLSGDVTVSF